MTGEIEPSEQCPHCGSENIRDVIDYRATDQPDLLECEDCGFHWELAAAAGPVAYIVAFLEGDAGLKAAARCSTAEEVRLAVLDRLQFAYGELDEELRARAAEVAGNLEALADQVALIELYGSQIVADLVVGRADHISKQWPGVGDGHPA